MINTNIDFGFTSYARTIKAKVEHFNGSTLANTFSYDGELQSLCIERTGEEGKFFGFGVCQKLKVAVMDAKSAIAINKGDRLEVTFFNENNEGLVFPISFYVNEVTRDENTGNLSVVAYDAIFDAAAHTVADLDITAPYTLNDFARACAETLGLASVRFSGGIAPALVCNTEYPEGANFNGTESIREALDAFAEATQSVYYINGDQLIFRKLKRDSGAAYTIDKAQYFTLKSEEPVVLAAIASVTDLGDNVSFTSGIDGETQYIRNNPFWDMREDIAEVVEDAVNAIGGLSLSPVDCKWRGNFLLEIGDKIEFIAKDGSIITSYLLNDTMNYNGGFNSVIQWGYTPTQTEHTNPSTIGEAIKETFAKVDKVNKQIDIVASETAANREEISSLQINTDSINASVSKMEETTNSALEAVNGEIANLTNKVNAAITAEDVRLEIETELANGVDKVVTSTGFTFNEEGLTVSKSGSEMKTTITEDGMKVYRDNTAVLTANNTGVDAVNLHATTYLIIGTNSRFEDYGSNRTGCFWIGG